MLHLDLRNWRDEYLHNVWQAAYPGVLESRCSQNLTNTSTRRLFSCNQISESSSIWFSAFFALESLWEKRRLCDMQFIFISVDRLGCVEHWAAFAWIKPLAGKKNTQTYQIGRGSVNWTCYDLCSLEKSYRSSVKCVLRDKSTLPAPASGNCCGAVYSYQTLLDTSLRHQSFCSLVNIERKRSRKDLKSIQGAEYTIFLGLC
jgi:hypothetical protein